MSSRRLRLLATFAGTAWLLSLTVDTGFSANPDPVYVNVADKEIGVGFGNLTENTYVFDLVVNLEPPTDKTIVSSEKPNDVEGDIIWQGPEKVPPRNPPGPPEREMHRWTGGGVLANKQHQVRFHGTLAGIVPGPGGGGGGTLPDFDVGVVDLDIDVNSENADTGEHSPPTGTPAEDKKEDETLAGVMLEKGMVETLNPNSHEFPGNIPTNPTNTLASLPYKILHLKCVPKWHTSNPAIGFVYFSTGVGVELYDITTGNKVTSVDVPANTGLERDYAIVSNDNLLSASITATFVWMTPVKEAGTHAQDIVKVQSEIVIDADIVDEPPTGATYASGVKQSSIKMQLNNGTQFVPTITTITNGFHVHYVPARTELVTGSNLVKLWAKDNAENEGADPDPTLWAFSLQ